MKLTESLFAARQDNDADLLVNGGGSVEYRVDPGYGMLVGAVRRVASVRLGSQVNIRIDLDGEQVWNAALTDDEPRGFEIAIDDARRVAFQVDHAGDGDVGDVVRLIRPRLAK